MLKGAFRRQAREQGQAGRQVPEPALPLPAAEVGEGALWFVKRREGLWGQVTQLPSTPVSQSEHRVTADKALSVRSQCLHGEDGWP